jgi:UDP-N-acetylglucosamine--N-acetylmuramyl-(pentapeptide) pyrophosphoryl-undecaprenol N-acetylglucosamine transferase
LIQNCELVISRSGAGTINELIQTGKPSILIPYPNSKNNHQEKNAMILSSIGGAILMNQNQISKLFFEETLKRILKFKLKKGKPKYEILDLMKENIKNLDTLKSTNEIKKLINYFLKEF